MTQSTDAPLMPAPAVPVWDPLVRIGHWLLVIAFAIAYVTEDELFELHEWAGYVVGAYVVVRLIWGFVGSEHARFADFFFSPFKGLAYLAALVRGRSPRYIGHSPAGAMMVFALLFMLAGTVITGMAELALSEGEGPLTLLLDKRAAAVETYTAAEEGEAREHEESLLLEVHELFANLTLILIVLHVLGVVIASVVHKESLVLAMITGRKRAPDGPA